MHSARIVLGNFWCFIFFAALLSGCTENSGGSSKTNADSDTGSDLDTKADSDTDSDMDADTDSDTDTTVADTDVDTESESDAANDSETEFTGLSALCTFDYDLTLSSHNCPLTQANPDYFCSTPSCMTYSWHDQCLGVAAREAVAECVARDAMIGIVSHASRDACWEGKVLPITGDNQFPEFTSSPLYDSTGGPFTYPAIDNKDNWNCDTCAYHMDPSLDKAVGISRVMTHFGLDPDEPADQQRVVFWDDSGSNISNIQTNMPDVVAIYVPRLNGGDDPNAGGCGITWTEIDAGWESVRTE